VLWDDLDLTVRAGEFIAVLGPNGTGKTSLLKVLLGQIAAARGHRHGRRQPVTEAAISSATSRSTDRWTAA
jgi:zinc/manganese transport system ATP-binding protein